MCTRGLAVCAVCGVASVAVADVAVDLRPNAAGPYALGQVVNVEAYFVDDGSGHPVTGQAIALRGFQIDFTDTDPTIKLPAAMNFWPAEPPWVPPQHPWGFPELPRPGWVYSGSTPSPDQVTIPVGGEFLFGDLDVTVNDSGWIDVMNAADPDPNVGAWISFGFGGSGDDPVTTWRAFTGELTGGRLFMEVPEPASLALLALGGVALLRRRRPALGAQSETDFRAVAGSGRSRGLKPAARFCQALLL